VIEYEKGLILDSMSEILAYYSSTNLKIEWTNRAAGESVGLSLNKLVGEHCYEIWHNRNEPCDGCPVVKSFETGKPEEDERTTPDGREWYVRSYPVISEKGAIEGVVEVVQNITERKQAEEALRESKERYEMATQAAKVGVWDWNIKTGEFYLDPVIKSFLGYSDEEIPNDLEVWVSYVHPDDRGPVMEAAQACLEGKTPEYFFEHRMIHKDGSIRWVDVHGSVIRDEQGNAIRMLGTDTDITERKQAEKQIKASLREKEVLLQEIHHRVKNNLQVISSLLNRKSKAIKYKKDAEVFRECQNFVGVMSIVHEKLYQNKDLASINFKDYIATVARELVRAYFPTKPDKVALKFELEDVSLGIDSAIPLGLVFNELITNSLKHAFPKNKKGEIRVSLHVRDEHEIELVVSDNGIGIPKDLDYRADETYGLYLVAGLVEKQLQGKIKISGKPVAGTEIKITFQEDNP
jgi:PAS domain S-box-containing protein